MKHTERMMSFDRTTRSRGDVLESDSNAATAPNSHAGAPADGDTELWSGARSVGKGVLPHFHMPDGKDRICIVDVIKPLRFGAAYFADDGNARPAGQCGGIQEFLLHREESPLRLLYVRQRFGAIQRELEDFHRGPIGRAFCVQHLPSQDYDLADMRRWSCVELVKRKGSVDLTCNGFRDHILA